MKRKSTISTKVSGGPFNGHSIYLTRYLGTLEFKVGDYFGFYNSAGKWVNTGRPKQDLQSVKFDKLIFL